MYIRKKVVGGQTYYQVVESKRIDGNPRQTILASLGRSETIALAIQAEKRRLTRLKRERRRLPEVIPEGALTAIDYAQLDRKIAEASAKIETLTDIDGRMKADAKQRSVKQAGNGAARRAKSDRKSR